MRGMSDEEHKGEKIRRKIMLEEEKGLGMDE